MTAGREIHLSWPEMAGGAAVLTLSAVLLFLILRRVRRRQQKEIEPDWAVPILDGTAGITSSFHCWDPRLKIVSLLLFAFLVVALRSLTTSLIALAIAMSAAVACRIPLARASARLGAMSGFLTMFLLILPLTTPDRPGETLLYLPGLPGLPFHVDGFFLALTIVCKACAVALLMEPLFATAPLPVTLAACARLGVPESLGRMVLLCHRYIFVFLHELRRMHRSMRVRGFVPGTDLATLNAVGNFLGMLFVRSFERTERVYEAMLCRGYHGSFPSFTVFSATKYDYAKAAVWILLGILLLVADLHYGMAT